MHRIDKFKETLSAMSGRRKRMVVLAVLVVIFSIFGYFTVSTAHGVPATRWMNIYHPEDFETFGEMLTYLKELRVPIPPVFSIMEILDYQATGNYRFVTVTLYRLGLVLVFIIVIVWASGSYGKMIPAFFLSLFFLWSTKVVHWANPQVYDIYLPLFILLFLMFTRLAASERFSSGKALVLFAVLSGFFLSMAELSRPFMILFLPFLLIWVYFKMGKRKKRLFLYFLIPVLLFSGIWHLKLLVFNGQLIWSNHSGFNLAKSWVFVEKPPLVPETGNAPLKPGRWKNLNTAEHFENSRRIQAQIVGYALKKPLASMAHIFRRMTYMMSVPTGLYKYKPLERHPTLYLYKFLVMVFLSYLFILVFWMVSRGVKLGRRCLGLLLEVDYILVLILFFSFLLFSLGESGEESRFLISLVPLLAVLPIIKIEHTEHTEDTEGCGAATL